MALFGIELGPSIDSLANDWINSNVPAPASYGGTITSLSSDITKWAQTCGNYVHQQNSLHNTANGTSTCQSKINSMYQTKLLGLETQEKQAIDTTKSGNPQLYGLVAIIVIVMIVIVLILKM